MNDSQISRDIALALLKIEAIKLSPQKPFTWSSGWKSPIYCDNRLSLSYPEIRTFIRDSLAGKIRQLFPQVEAIAGVATAGIPQGALVADLLGLPFIYVRAKPKGHGAENLIEGRIQPGKNVIVIEDLISTGGSSLKAVEAIRRAGMNVSGLGAIFTYGFEIAEKAFREAQLNYFTLSNYSTLLEEACKSNYITDDQLVTLKAWNRDPSQWESERTT